MWKTNDIHKRSPHSIRTKVHVLYDGNLTVNPPHHASGPSDHWISFTPPPRITLNPGDLCTDIDASRSMCCVRSCCTGGDIARFGDHTAPPSTRTLGGTYRSGHFVCTFLYTRSNCDGLRRKGQERSSKQCPDIIDNVYLVEER